MNAEVNRWLRWGHSRDLSVPGSAELHQPSWFEVSLMVVLMFALHLVMVCRVATYWDVAGRWFDNRSYLQIAAIIRNWHFVGQTAPQHFWGFPFAIAAISGLFHISPLCALVAISMLGSLATCLLVHRLYGGWVACAFAVINYRWIYTSVEGGSEPLFMCLLYASFLMARSNRWNTAGLLGSLSTTVRPVGFMSLASFAFVLARRKAYRELMGITVIGLAIGVIYLIPLKIILGNPFHSFLAYREDWGQSGWPVTYPFGAIVPSFFAALHSLPWPVIVFFVLWLVVALAGGVALWLPRDRMRLSMDQPDALFTSIYVLFFICYNFSDIVGDFPRFLMPAAPMLVFSLRDRIPNDRRILWATAFLSALLASAAQVGFKNVFGFGLPRIR